MRRSVLTSLCNPDTSDGGFGASVPHMCAEAHLPVTAKLIYIFKILRGKMLLFGG